MTKNPYVKSPGRWPLKLAMVPAALVALVTLEGAPNAYAGNVLQESAAAQAVAQRVNEGAKALEGSWLYTVTIPGSSPVVFLGTETYAEGGGYSEADQLSFTPGYLATAGHGAWKETSERSFLLTYMNLTYDAYGNATGTSKVRQTMKLADDGTEYGGSGDFFYYDLYGNVVASGAFTITAKKIAVERPH
jgi:hypothetical protein